MNDHSRRFIDDDDGGIFIDDIERVGSGFIERGLGFGRVPEMRSLVSSVHLAWLISD
jgi:hypothetical protein